MRNVLRRFLAILLLLLCPALALGEALGPYPYAFTGDKLVRSYETQTLVYTVESCKVKDTKCYITKVWMQDPGKQIGKGMSEWEKHLATVQSMARQVEGAALVINGSGFVSPMFPEIPDNYPGRSEDYYYTALGSITVLNGEVLRNLEGVPFYGLTLESDGLHMWVGADNEEVLARSPSQTWSFYERCPLIQDHQSILDRTWDFANRKAIRTIIAQMDANNYVILTATSIHGLTLLDATDFLMEAFNPVWAYDLDGGPSSALMCRKVGNTGFKMIYNTSDDKKVADIMAFRELPAE